jgi:nitrite reductase/ring-hydroxylating ferredoxin subunit
MAHSPARAFWHAAATSESLKDWPLGLSLLDEPVMLARMDGGVAALRDVCSHMDAALSGGWVMRGAAGDELVCPHHRWRYNATGRCTHIPDVGDEGDGAQNTPDWTAVPRYGVAQRYGLIWVCLEDAPQAGPPDLPQFERPGALSLPIRAQVWKRPAQDVAEAFVAQAGRILGAGEATLFSSLTAGAWASGAGRAVLFAVSPLTRAACRSFWVPVAPPGEDAGRAGPWDEQAYAALGQALAA